MVLDSLFPVFALITLGTALKHWRLTTTAFLQTADRLVYYIFFPTLLFWKIGGGSPGSAGLNGPFFLAAILAVVLIHLLSLVYIRWQLTDFQAGAFSQGCHRFNTYIGMAIAITAFGEAGARQFGLLIGVMIPINNILAVATLTWYARGKASGAARIGQTVRAMASNPLIIACAAGLIYSRTVGGFPVFIDNALGLMAAITLPLALLSIGGALTLAGLREYRKPLLVGAGLKLVALPLVGGALLLWAGVGGLEFKVGMVFFALPISPATYVLSAQLHSDSRLAAAAIVTTTALSVFSLAIILTLVG
jgi:predicted permease